MRVADKIFQILRDYTDVVFMLPGGGAMYLVDALGQSGIPYVPMLHEQSAGLAACAYAQVSGKLGVCLVTSGPGATNAVTACATAWTDSFPVLFISGQTRLDQFDPELRTSGVQSVNIVPVVHPIAKMAYITKIGEGTPEVARIMANLCLEGRQGPCWLDVPQDIQGEVLE